MCSRVNQLSHCYERSYYYKHFVIYITSWVILAAVPWRSWLLLNTWQLYLNNSHTNLSVSTTNIAYSSVVRLLFMCCCFCCYLIVLLLFFVVGGGGVYAFVCVYVCVFYVCVCVCVLCVCIFCACFLLLVCWYLWEGLLFFFFFVALLVWVGGCFCFVCFVLIIPSHFCD